MTEVQVFEGNGKHPPPATTKEAIEILRPLLMPYKGLNVKMATVTRGHESILLSEAIQIAMKECEYQTNPHFREEFSKDIIFSGVNDFHKFGLSQQVTFLVEMVLERL